MLNKEKLGEAIKIAIEKKIDSGSAKSKAEIARHFGIRPPSIHDWIKKGSIDKEKLPELFSYFSDVVPLEHWGLRQAEAQMFTGLKSISSASRNEVREDPAEYGRQLKKLPDPVQKTVDLMLSFDHETQEAMLEVIKPMAKAMQRMKFSKT